VVFLVGVTGALYVFEREIRDLYLRSYARVSPAGVAGRLPVSLLHQRAAAALMAAVGPRPTYRWGPLTVQVSIKNATNTTYFTGNFRSQIQPGEPLTVLGRLTLKLP
jgi:uncharacterized iron-regulated membrane protein